MGAEFLANAKQKTITRTALLLALALACQSLRFVLPAPVILSTFIIGSLVNACLLIALQAVGLRPSLLIACVTPIVAYFQQLLPLPIFIVPVAVGNSLFVWLFQRLLRIGRVWPAIGGATLGKTAFFYLAFSWLLTFIQLPKAMATAIMFVMSWPQLVTGILGGVLAHTIWRRLGPVVEGSQNNEAK